jgi:trehalose 2-sulfotransferase
MVRNYLICATPRSGSNLLCELLSSLGFAGLPQEHLWDPPGTEPEPLSKRWSHVLQAGTGDNGVFGLKLMWYQAARLECELPEILGMPGESLARVLAATLDNPVYISLTRCNHMHQAISLARAIQTGQWRSMDAIAIEPYYDAQAIAEGIEFLRQDEADWNNFFCRNEISPYRLTYEALESSPEQVVTELLTVLGEDEPPRISLLPAHHRQADDVTEEWLRRYTRDRPNPVRD